MKRYFFTAILLIATTTTAYASEHKHGDNNHCWYETGYGKKDEGENWAYYFCGKSSKKCAGKTYKKHDKLVLNYHGDSFTFKNKPNDKYFCCNGTKETEGIYVQSDNWIVNTETERVTVDGGLCNKLIQTDACGETHIIECRKPDECPEGTTMRNDKCIFLCSGDKVFESIVSNECITCETTAHQGISADGTYCVTCKKDTEFFSRKTRTCVKKDALQLTQYSKESMKECWMCPRESGAFEICVKAVTAVNKAGITDPTRRKEQIKLEAIKITPLDKSDVMTQCHLN